MSEISRKLELSDNEVKTLIEILKYSLVACPVEGISPEVQITIDRVQDLIDKLEKTLMSE